MNAKTYPMKFACVDEAGNIIHSVSVEDLIHWLKPYFWGKPVGIRSTHSILVDTPEWDDPAAEKSNILYEVFDSNKERRVWITTDGCIHGAEDILSDSPYINNRIPAYVRYKIEQSQKIE